MWKTAIWVAVLAALAAVFSQTAVAGPTLSLRDGNSTVTIDPYTSGGVTEWNVSGTSQLAQQWFWFRTNLSGWNTREYAINEIGTPLITQPADNYVQIRYVAPAFSVQVTYVLVGGTDADTSDLAEIIKITNRSTSTPLVFTLFQYSNFQLGGTATDNSVLIADNHSAYQYDTSFVSNSISETVVTASPDLSEVGPVPQTLGKLTDLDIDDLNGTTEWATPGNLSWSFEWRNRTISPTRSLLISKDKVLTFELASEAQPVPEPAPLALVGLLLLLALRKRRT